METRIALLGIIVENTESAGQLNHLLHEYSRHIIGRMGIPYRERDVNIISIAIDAPQDVINALPERSGVCRALRQKPYTPASGAAIRTKQIPCKHSSPQY